MKHIIYNNHYWLNDRAWHINTTKSGIRTDILRVLLLRFNDALEQHSKVFVFRFDLHLPKHTPTNTVISPFLRQVGRRAKRKYGNSFRYVWAREQEKSKQQHYHFTLFMDGNKIKSPHYLQGWIEDAWAQTDGNCHWSGYHRILRGDETALQEAAYHISYLAKPRGKGYRPPQTKDYGSSIRSKTTL